MSGMEIILVAVVCVVYEPVEFIISMDVWSYILKLAAVRAKLVYAARTAEGPSAISVSAVVPVVPIYALTDCELLELFFDIENA